MRFKQFFGVGKLSKVVVSSFAFISSCITVAKASTVGFLDTSSMTVRPMYGVIAPVVKYGPPNPTIAPAPGGGSSWINFPAITVPQWSVPGNSVHFTAPDFSQWAPVFPKLLGAIGIIAYFSLIIWAVCGWTVLGSVWYVKNKGKK